MSKSKETISIDKKACIGCGICASVCPFTVLAMENGEPRLQGEKRCLECLHCAAACPRQAVLFRGGNASADPIETPCEPAGGDPGLSGLPASFSAELAKHIMGRRSYRHFSSRPLEPSLIEEALSLADFAPSAKNQHPVGWIVVNGKEKTEEIMNRILPYIKETGLSPEILTEYEAGNNVVMGTAPTLIMGYADSASINPWVDTALALNCIELYLQSRGVGTCWAGYLTRLSNAVPALKELFVLPDGAQFYAALMAGYPQRERYLRLPKRTRPAAVKWI